MKCFRCRGNQPLILNMGNWGIPYFRCSKCDHAVQSEICIVLENGTNHNLKSMDEYLAFCNTCKELRA